MCGLFDSMLISHKCEGGCEGGCKGCEGRLLRRLGDDRPPSHALSQPPLHLPSHFLGMRSKTVQKPKMWGSVRHTACGDYPYARILLLDIHERLNRFFRYLFRSLHYVKCNFLRPGLSVGLLWFPKRAISYRVFIIYCVFFSIFLNITDSGLSLFSLGISVFRHTGQVEP